ncbi:MAG TPA: 4-aminobutyrate--2-oxoglutarate transaminase [Acidimicrobiales bacterium]|nr:4-aminobutyrate--2-oxoglutarate transaminase [Acidimicrobiales bacterium]
MDTTTERLEQRRQLRTEIPGPRSRALMERRRAAVPAGVGTTLGIFVARAAGGIVEDVDGNRLIDFASGISVTNVGNSAPRVVHAVQEQVACFTHTCFQVVPYEGYVAVCERLNALTPGDHAKRSLLVNSGAEAVENAVKVARYATGRPGVVAFDHGFHGRTLLGMSLTGKEMPYKEGFGPFPPEVLRAPYSDPFRGTGTLAETVEALDAAASRYPVACVVVEPVAGEGGFVVPAPGWLAGVAAWCRDNGALVVADEIQSGFGRTGAWFACEHEGVVPDLVTTAKSLGGGLPIGGVTGRAEIMDAVHAGGLGGTFGGNPLSCAAALAAIDTMEADGLVERAGAMGETMLAKLESMAAAHAVVGEARGRGAMVAIELVRDDGVTPNPEATKALAGACHARGLLVLTAGTYGNVLRLLPPLVIPDDLLEEGLGIIDEALSGL